MGMLLALGMLSACSRNSDDTLKEQVNDLLQPYLKGAKLDLAPLRGGEEVKIPGLFAVASAGERNCLSIAFPREGFDDRFIKDLFSPPDNNRPATPFAAPGVEAILVSDKVILNLYAGVVLHIQSGVVYLSGHKTFKVQPLNGQVVKVVGHAMREVQSKPMPSSLAEFHYSRESHFFPATSDREKLAEQSRALARMGSTVQPAIADKSATAASVACKDASN
jgi:hypothetical protein